MASRSNGADRRPVLIHPGFHKTGTTFLQTEVFTDTRLFRLLWWHEGADRFVARPHDLDFDPAPGRADIAARRAEPCAEGLIDVVSSEILCGTPFYGSRECAARAHRLKAVFGQGRILLTVRRQQAIIRAVYVQYLKQGGTLGPERFFDQAPEFDYFGFDAGNYEFHKLAELYAELFGKDNVLVLTQETLQREPDEFLRRLCVFCGVENGAERIAMGEKDKQGVSPPASGLPVLRLANRFRGGVVNPEMRGALKPLGDLLEKAAYRQTWLFRDQRERLDGAVKSRFAGAYAESNARLQQFAACDLRALGYEMPAQGQAQAT
jgi:hypothetical protein